LRICNVYVTLKEITQLEIAASSSTDIQERATTETRKEDNQKKDEDNLGDKRFQQSKGTVAVIFAKIPGSRSKHQDKLAIPTIMAVEPATPKYLNWSQYPIQFSRED
jgi:hypothetical protein